MLGSKISAIEYYLPKKKKTIDSLKKITLGGILIGFMKKLALTIGTFLPKKKLQLILLKKVLKNY